MSPLTDLSFLIPAVAGAVGALALRSLLKLVGKQWASVVPVAKYPCVKDSVKPGYFRHGWGEPTTDKDKRGKKVWSYTSVQMRQWEHTLFGPYVNDFGRPGFFRVRFKLSGHGFDKRSDEPIVVIDVIQAPFDQQRDHLVIGQRVIRSSELSPQYKDFDILCYTSGTGVYEYRASVVRDNFNEAHNKIYFDNVRVYRHFPLWDVL
jgi:hypothetical protein